MLEETQLTLAHNSIVQTSAGPGGVPDGQAGQSCGIQSTNSDVDLMATALAWHSVGLLHMTGTIQLAENSFWLNDVDTLGVSPSPTDLHGDPGFVDIDAGDLHLQPTSALIDRAGDYGPVSLLTDIDHQPRPLDGNGDNVYRADIGADERFLAQNVLYLQPEPNKAMPGERIGIIAVIENPNPDLVQRGVTFASSLPAELEVLADSLHASGGVVSLVEEDGRQRVSWSGQVPAQNAVVIRYQLGAVAANASPRWIVVTARSGETMRR